MRKSLTRIHPLGDGVVGAAEDVGALLGVHDLEVSRGQLRKGSDEGDDGSNKHHRDGGLIVRERN